jgi:hypothetical protein
MVEAVDGWNPGQFLLKLYFADGASRAVEKAEDSY